MVLKTKKMNLFKMSNIKRILVSKKKVLKTRHPFSQPNYENENFQARSPDLKLLSNLEKLLTAITIFKSK